MNRPTLDPARLTWRKASASSDQGACVEVAHDVDWVAVRDSKDTGRRGLTVAASAFAAFLEAAKTGTLSNTP
ncbi:MULTISPECIES: DUF397 domain-containing protein [Streptomyces]|uniref:DUF397 domain-containing protein n=1 Tax=Streptomyces katrae TaxID=68223 RepID=A0A0F4JFK7_9ACTN|nr:DUF397 domain-containing protein [Streptomyces katrae]KJY31771.1 hypothetical protein VR44_17530 [Streptomyces katrae]